MAALLTLLGFALMALLPVTFFRKGRLNVRWWLTATPFAATSLVLLHGLARGLVRSTHPTRDALAVMAASGAIALLLSARAAHVAAVPLWHQDALPEGLVQDGPYRRIRHPFYASFLLLLLAGALAAPNAVSLGSLLMGVAVLTWTAVREERALLSSRFGAAYREYVERTGRFFPRLGRTP